MTGKKLDAFGWEVDEKDEDAAIAKAIAAVDEPVPIPGALELTGLVVIDDVAAKRLYPYCNRTSPQLYPGKLVPRWAVELRAGLASASVDSTLGDFSIRDAMRAFGKWKAPELEKAGAVLAVCAVARLANPGQQAAAARDWLVQQGVMAPPEAGP